MHNVNCFELNLEHNVNCFELNLEHNVNCVELKLECLTPTLHGGGGGEGVREDASISTASGNVCACVKLAC